MPILTNSRWEKFAQLIAAGVAITDAHEQAGYIRNDGNAPTLAKRPEIAGRIAEIKENVSNIVADELALDRAGVLRELAKIAKAPDGDQWVKASDKRAACMDYARIQGWVIERREVGEPGEFNAMEDFEIYNAIRQEAAELGVDLAGAADTRH